MPTGLMRRLREAAVASDAGVTLVELIVAMTLSTILGAMTLSLFINIDTSSANTTDRTMNTASARNALQAWTEYIGVADGPTVGSRVNRIEWLTSNDMMMHVDLFNRTMSSVGTTAAPTMVWLRRDVANQLVEEQFSNAAAQGANPTVCRVLLTNVTGTQPLFTPLASRGRSMTGLDLGTAPTAAKGCVPLPVTVPSQSNHPDAAAQANLQNVYSITIDFIAVDSRSSHPIEFTSQAVLPALGGGA